jgi:hypothetical protein
MGTGFGVFAVTCAANGLQADVARNWLEEFEADLMPCKMLLIAIADGRFGDVKPFEVSPRDARFQAARTVLNGVAAAFEAIYWVDVQRSSPTTPEMLLSASHYISSCIVPTDAPCEEALIVSAVACHFG